MPPLPPPLPPRPPQLPPAFPAGQPPLPRPVPRRAKPMPGLAIALIVMAGCVVLVVPILAAISIPAYNDYLMRSRVAGALALANAFKPQLAEAQLSGKSCPGADRFHALDRHSLDQFKIQSVEPSDGPDGCGIKVLFSEEAGFRLRGQTLLLSLTPDGNWSCDGTVQEKLLPTSCRPH